MLSGLEGAAGSGLAVLFLKRGVLTLTHVSFVQAILLVVVQPILVVTHLRRHTVPALLEHKVVALRTLTLNNPLDRSLYAACPRVGGRETPQSRENNSR